MANITPSQSNADNITSTVSTLTNPGSTPSVARTNNGAATPTVLFAGTPSDNKAASKEDGLVAAINAITDNKDDTAQFMLGELSMQDAIFREQDKTKRDPMVSKWFKKIKGGAGVFPMVCVVKGYLRVVFGLAEYMAGFGEECDYDEALIGFMGDRVKSKRPLVINLSKKVGWREEKNVFTGEATLRTFFSNKDNARKFYVVGGSDSTSTMLLPTLLQVPRQHVKWLLEQSRTPWEYHEKLLLDLGGDQPDQRPPQLATSLVFLQNACTEGKDKKSVGEMKIEPVFSEDFKEFDRWIGARLTTVLGPSVEAGPVVQNVIKFPEQPPGSSPFTQNGGGSTGGVHNQLQGGGGSGTNDKAALSEVQIAALQGWCHARYIHQIPKVWTELQSTTDVADMRRFIDSAWEESRKALNIGEGECNIYYLNELQVKEFKQLKFAPGGPVLVWDYLMKGMSILLMSMYSAQAQLNSAEQDRIYDETVNTRTEEQAARRTKKEPREPPRTWHTLKSLVNTYAIMLHALFSHRCPHFESVWAIRDVLVSMRERTSVFTAYRCKLIVTHIMKDSKRYFSVHLMPKDLDFDWSQVNQQVQWPLSHLAEVAKHIFLQTFAALEIADMPAKWMESGDNSNSKRKANDQGGRSGSDAGGGQWQQGSQGMLPWPQRGGGTGSGSQGGASFQRSGASSQQGAPPAKIQSRVGNLLDECKRLAAPKRFGFREMRELGGLDGRFFPRLTKYEDSYGRNDLCNAGLLGICHFGGSNCRFKHVDPRDVSDEFADAVAQYVVPSLNRCIDVLRSGAHNNGGPAQQQGPPSQQGGGMGRGTGWNGPRRF